MEPLHQNIKKIREQIEMAAREYGRDPTGIRLIAVSKTHPSEKIRDAFQLLVTDFGENKAQDFRKKYEELQDLEINWHFIGHLQTNKVKYVVGRAGLIHSLDSLKTAEAIDRFAKNRDLVQQVLIQVNTSGEVSKSGVSPQDVFTVVERLQAFPRIRIQGLMCIARYSENEKQVREEFSLLRELGLKMEQQNYTTVEKMELSMGMSHDFKWAIAEGSTMVRIGTAIFGERHNA